ncbi:hypothetical protein [Vreelandella rituensis]|nr:hypothetical protein [Halomonas rituensis]
MEALLDLVRPGGEQDAYLAQIKDRFGEMLASQGEHALRPIIDSVQASVQEVLNAIKRSKDEAQDILVRLNDFDDALDDQFHQVKANAEATNESLHEIMDSLSSLRNVDLTQVQMDLQSCLEEVTKDVIQEHRASDQKALDEMLAKSRKAFLESVQSEMDGQNVLMQDRLRKSNADLAKAVEGTTYTDALKKLQSQVTDLTEAKTTALSERDALQRKLDKQSRGKSIDADTRVLSPAFIISVAVGASVLSAAASVTGVAWLFGAI